METKTLAPRGILPGLLVSLGLFFTPAPPPWVALLTLPDQCSCLPDTNQVSVPWTRLHRALPLPLGNVPTAIGFRQGLISLSSELPSVAASYPIESIETQDHDENVWFTVKAPVQVLSALVILAKLLPMFALHVCPSDSEKRGGGNISSTRRLLMKTKQTSFSQLLGHKKHSTHTSRHVTISGQQGRTVHRGDSTQGSTLKI